MCHYKHLTLLEREKLLHFRDLGKSITAIAQLLGRNKGTISRELRRNATNGKYLPAYAEEHYHERRKACKPEKKLAKIPKLLCHVQHRLLDCQWSPEQIAGRLRAKAGDTCVISFSTIYRAIYSGMLSSPGHSVASVVRKLRHGGKRRRKRSTEERRGKIQISHSIDERPVEAEERSVIGHFEADTVIGRQGKACLVTLVDRKSRYLICDKVESKTADAVSKAMSWMLMCEPVLSITPDRGKEFAKHQDVTEALDGVPFYFPEAHQPWQRGTNENTNGLLREYFPKGKDMSDINKDDLDRVVRLLNFRPRKCLGYQTPYEVYHSKVLHFA